MPRRLLASLALPAVLVLFAPEAHAAPKKSKPTANQTQVDPSTAKPKTPVTKPAAEKPKGPTKRRPNGIPTPGSSLVGNGSDAARRWMTPLITNASELRENEQKIQYNYQKYSHIYVINPDKEETLHLLLTCYDLEGKQKGEIIETDVGPLAVTFLAPPVQEEVWCQVATNLPSIAYLYLYHFRRHRGDTPDTITEQKVVPLFKLMR